jgi:hypothetical protein
MKIMHSNNQAHNLTVKLADKPSAQYQGHTQQAIAYVLCPQNSRVVSQSPDGLHLWCATTGVPLAYYPINDNESNDEDIEEFYITQDENYLIASTFAFDPLDDNHCYQSLMIFYIGKDKPITQLPLHATRKQLAKNTETIMVVESLAIWCELSDNEILIHTLGDVDCGREEGIKEHIYQVTWQNDIPSLTHQSERIVDSENINWSNDFVNMLPIVYLSD